jgi:hypothetical protein
MMRYAKLIVLGALTMLLLALPGSAAAKSKDRNHDRISDRWERSHHLSLRVNQARKDQDHDGLKNRGEFRAQTDPKDDDSDNDGVEDGDEKAGTVTAFDGTNLTVTLFAGGSVTGKVTPQTEIECDTQGDDDDGDDDADESSLRHDDEGDDEGDGDNNQHGDDSDEEGDNKSCPPDALKTGAIVQEAELKLGSGGAVFTEIELLK